MGFDYKLGLLTLSFANSPTIQLRLTLDRGFPSPGKVRMRFIAVRDIGWFAAYMLVNSERYESKELEIASEILSYDEAAAAFARFTKKPFKHRRADPSQLPTRPGGTKPAPGSSKNLIFSAEPEALAKIHPGITKIDTWIAEEWNGRHEYLKARM